MKPIAQVLAASSAAAVLLLGSAAGAQTVYTGDILQRNSFGEVVREYHTEVAGQVSTLQRDAMIEPGT